MLMLPGLLCETNCFITTTDFTGIVILKETNTNAGVLTVSVRYLPEGIHLVKVESEKHAAVQRVVVLND
jgi:hypothetical protein